ncbi:hypothetical protein Lal_00010884 [Lupinus albus]|nr:hypothetical protein Lal_00010884 [Lupinus albus]
MQLTPAVFDSFTKQCSPCPRAKSPTNRITHARRHLDTVDAQHLQRNMIFFMVSHIGQLQSPYMVLTFSISSRCGTYFPHIWKS